MDKWCVLVVVAALTASFGCQRSLFRDQAARTQYDRYMAVRGQERPMERENVWGGKEPALRERLRPLETQ